MRPLAIAAALLLQGCASALYQGPSVVDIDVTGPTEGVELTISGVQLDDVRHEKGPHAKLTLDRDSSYVIMATADGYMPRLFTVSSLPSLGSWLDLAPELLALPAAQLAGPTNGSLVFLGGLGLTVAFYGLDAANHVLGEHNTHTVALKLEPAR